MVKETLTGLRKLAKGTGIKVTKVKGTDNVVISGAGFDPLYKQLNSTVGLSATNVIKAMKGVIASERGVERK